MDQSLKLLKSNFGMSGTPNASLAQTGIEPNALSGNFTSTTWIIDSGASDHVTSLSCSFHTYNPCSGHEKIRIANGSYSPIAGKWSINLSKTISLESVLHVPKLDVLQVPKLARNLLSVSKLSRDSSCCVFSKPELREDDWQC